MVQVGYNQRKRNQVFYLYADTDTLSYERMVPGHPDQVVFGWMFRPVLGRRSISPGLRQLFALVALPAKDGDGQHVLDAKVRTYWKKYDRKTMTSYLANDANRATKAGFLASLSLSEPQIFGNEYVNSANYDHIVIDSTTDYEAALRAKVDVGAWWQPVGPKGALVTVRGHNFFTDTKVAIGDKTYATTADGLIIKSSETFDLLTTIDSLATGSGEIISRYGGAVPILAPTGPPDGIEIQGTMLRPSQAGIHRLTFILTGTLPPDINVQPMAVPGGAVMVPSLPIVTVNDKAVPLPYDVLANVPANTQFKFVHHEISVNVPGEYIQNGGGVAKLSWPFLPHDLYTQTIVIGGTPFVVTRVSDKTISIVDTDLLGFTKDANGHLAAQPYCWTLLATDHPIVLHSATCPGGAPGPVEGPNLVSATIDSGIPDHIVLLAPNTSVYNLDVPKLKADDTTPKPIALTQYDSMWVDIPKIDYAKVDYVEANQLHLQFRQAKADRGDKSTAIQVEVTRELTAKPGTIDVTVLGKADPDSKYTAGGKKPLGSVKLQISCSHCSQEGAHQ